MEIDYCPWNDTNPYTTSWITQAITTPIVIILEIAWFFHQIVWNHKNMSKIPKPLHILYISIQIIAIIWTIYGLFKLALLPVLYPDSIYNIFICLLIAYPDKIFVFFYESILLLQILLRLNYTFRKPSGLLGIKTYKRIILFILLIIPTIIIMPLFLISLESPCYYKWISDYSDGKILYFCSASFTNSINVRTQI